MRPIAAVILFASSTLFAADHPEKTFGMKNGHFWMALEGTSSRSAFLAGMIEGWTFRNSTEQAISGKYIIAFFATGDNFQLTDLADMVTSVYNDTENVTLPIGWVAVACLAVQRGETTRQSVFLDLRKHLTKMISDTSDSALPDWNPIDVIIKSKVK